jgi:hypothetical protein
VSFTGTSQISAASTRNLLLDPLPVEFAYEETPRGVWRRHVSPNGVRFAEYTSHAQLFGVPMVHIVKGRDPATLRKPVARGIIAIGQRAVGVIAIGQLSFDVFAIGQLAIGLMFGFGQATTEVLALGQFAFGYFSAGQFRCIRSPLRDRLRGLFPSDAAALSPERCHRRKIERDEIRARGSSASHWARPAPASAPSLAAGVKQPPAASRDDGCGDGDDQECEGKFHGKESGVRTQRSGELFPAVRIERCRACFGQCKAEIIAGEKVFLVPQQLLCFPRLQRQLIMIQHDHAKIEVDSKHSSRSIVVLENGTHDAERRRTAFNLVDQLHLGLPHVALFEHQASRKDAEAQSAKTLTRTEYIPAGLFQSFLCDFA